MHQKEKEKCEQVEKRLAIVKSACILFVGAICFKTLFLHMSEKGYSSASYAIYITIILVGIYYSGSFLMRKGILQATKRRYYIESITLNGTILAMIMVTGGYRSPYKFLFLVIIITTTIELGRRQGLYVGSIISVVILGMDLLYAPHEGINIYFENDLILAGIFWLTAWVLGVYVEEESKYTKVLQEMVNHDGLTGVYNHRYFYEKLKEVVQQATDNNQPVALLFLDIDYFKHYNDLNGHQAGDQILRNIGDLLKEKIGIQGIVARYGGEEFAILLPNYDHQSACEVAEEVRKTVEEAKFPGQQNQPDGNLTLSIGVSSYPLKAKDEIELVKSADDALYRAKFFEKNRVETYSSILDELEKNINKDEIEIIGSLKTLIGMINIKDRYTYGHIERVVMYSKLIAKEIGLSEKDTRTLVCGAYIHDIGKINIDEDILIKQMPLTGEEWTKLKEHPENGVEIIRYIGCLQDTKSIIRHHHERYDGSGYPSALKGEEIPYLARILTVVDSFDAMTSHRSYNRRKTNREAIEELRRCKNTQFDPDITETFIQAFSKKSGNTL